MVTARTCNDGEVMARWGGGVGRWCGGGGGGGEEDDSLRAA